MPQEKTTKKKLLEKLYSLSHDVIWEIEASREIEGKSFIKPSDLKRITELIDNISNDVEKTISQTREETLGEIKRLLPNNSSDGDTDFADGYDTYRKEVLDILNKLKN